MIWLEFWTISLKNFEWIILLNILGSIEWIFFEWIFGILFWIEFLIESFLGPIQWKNEFSKRIAHPYLVGHNWFFQACQQMC